MRTAVVTTVQLPTSQMQHLAEKVGRLIVVGDVKGPDHYLKTADFLPFEDQTGLPFKLAGELPTGSYARKNLGYLRAMHLGAECIYETDDDNRIGENWSWRDKVVSAEIVGAPGWCNVYRWFSNERVWPRGLPLEEVRSVGDSFRPELVDAPVQQALVDGDPDVDAIYRMVLQGDGRFQFARRSSVLLDFGVWCPFNSQNTHWWPEAYPLLYLPATCSFRMTDIWRSFVAQRCLWRAGYRVAYHAPDATQDRNDHDLKKDLKGELDGLLHNQAIRRCLEELTLGNILVDNMWICYEALHRLGVFSRQELDLLKLWLEDIT